MATGTASFSGGKYKFNIGYSYTNTSFKITSVKTTCLESGWAAWELMPALFFYVLKGSSPVPKDYQNTADTDPVKKWITDRSGKYENYQGNDPTGLLSNSDGGVVNWSSSKFDNLSLSLSGSSVTLTVGALIVNSTGTLSNVVYGSDTFTLQLYTAPTGYSLQIINSTINSITAKHSWTNGSDTVSTHNITIGSDVKSVGNGSSVTFTGLKSNTLYTVNGKISDGTTTRTDSGTRWTYPKLDPTNGLILSLPSGLEHDQIKADAKAEVSTTFDQFAFKFDSNAFSAWGDSTELYTDLVGHSTHTITAKMKNTTSGYESAEVSKTITIWYDPIYSLSVSLTNKWFWYLATKAIFDYQGGAANITKYEFIIGNETYQNKGTTNAYSRGTTTPGNSNNLSYNTSYFCKVRLTDNHGRTKEAQATFKTLDERPLYVNGVLREVKIIKPDKSVSYVTPNLLSVIQPDGTLINMNKIINNDDRTEFK